MSESDMSDEASQDLPALTPAAQQIVEQVKAEVMAGKATIEFLERYGGMVEDHGVSISFDRIAKYLRADPDMGAAPTIEPDKAE